MARPLRVLLVEDSADDAELLLLALRRQGIEPTLRRVETREAMASALEQEPWDVILSDYALPRFSALDALALAKHREIDIPFIIISGTVGEETAVQALKQGAHDFLLKGNLVRLGPAIEREMRESTIRAERRTMQEQLVLADRMVSMGTLAAGVAHEINNPLASVLANLEFALQGLDEFGRYARERSAVDAASTRWGRLVEERIAGLRDPLEDARECCERIRLIVQDVKTFSRPDDRHQGLLDVRSVLESSLRIVWNDVRHRARLKKEYGEVPLVQANESRLGQVFLNLIVNATQAISEGKADENEIRIVTFCDGAGRAVIEVHDTGIGISPDSRSRIFDPFFTTKPVGIGTGLGLAICQRIVASLEGRIEVESELGQGTMFRVVLPPAKLPVSDRPPPPVAPPAQAQSTSTRARILVVDDEELLGGVLRRALQRDHEVEALTDARAIVPRLAAGERFDVIFCDLMMPQMSGPELHAAVTRVAPEQVEKIVFMTGGAFTATARAFLEGVPNARIEKPFAIESVRSLVRRMLADSQRPR